MTKNERIYQYMSSFGVPAYPVGSVPTDATYPYLVYENSVGEAGDPPVYIAARLYYYTESQKLINDKVDEIARSIGKGGKMLSYDGGGIWLQRGTPWSVVITDDNPALKGRQLNITLEFV